MDKNHKLKDLILVPQAIEILRHYHRENVKPTDYIFPLLSNDAEFAKYTTLADVDTMAPELRAKMIQNISAKNALINKYLKKIAEKAEITKPLSMHISRHSFAHLAQEAGVESGAIKNILAHSSLATTEKYMGNFDTAKTDATLRSLFAEKEPVKVDPDASAEEQAISLLKGMTPEQIMKVLAEAQKK